MTTKEEEKEKDGALKELAARPNGKKMAEQRAKVAVDWWVLEKSREVIRSRGGMISTEEAIEEVWKDPKTLDDIAAHFAKHNPAWGIMFKENPRLLKEEIDKAIAEMESFD